MPTDGEQCSFQFLNPPTGDVCTHTIATSIYYKQSSHWHIYIYDSCMQMANSALFGLEIHQEEMYRVANMHRMP